MVPAKGRKVLPLIAQRSSGIIAEALRSATPVNSAPFAGFQMIFPNALEHEARMHTINIARTNPSEMRLHSEKYF